MAPAPSPSGWGESLLLVSIRACVREAASAFCQKKCLNAGRQADTWATKRLNIRTDIDISSTSSRVPCAALGDTRWFSVSRASEDVASPWARPPQEGVQRLCPLVRAAQGSPFIPTHEGEQSRDLAPNAAVPGEPSGPLDSEVFVIKY